MMVITLVFLRYVSADYEYKKASELKELEDEHEEEAAPMAGMVDENPLMQAAKDGGRTSEKI